MGNGQKAKEKKVYDVSYGASKFLTEARGGAVAMKKRTVYFSEEMAAEVKIRARQERRTQAAVIREALAVYLADTKGTLPSFVGMVSDGSFSGADDETYLAEHWKPDW
jgi:hypothetical protein